MAWYCYVAHVFAGLFLSNGVPHFVSGVQGRALQSPFAKPPGVGLSSSTVNVLWGTFNFAVGYLLLLHVGTFDMKNLADVAVVAAPALLGSLFLASRMGRYHGGNNPRSQA
jgi:hypothetical protein